MTVPTSTPDAPQPITTAPELVVEELRKSMPTLDKLVTSFPPGDPEASERDSNTAADKTRLAFPHLDDLTLAALYSVVAQTEMAGAYISGSIELMVMAATHANLAKHLAWSLATPDGAGHE